MDQLVKIIEKALNDCKKEGRLKVVSIPDILLEQPKRPEHGDLSTNIALALAGAEGKSPRQVAGEIKNKIKVPNDILTEVSIAGPGFINFRINQSCFIKVLDDVYKAGKKFGRSKLGKGKKVQVEFVSANPTGPLHVGHGRGAVYGDALASVLEANGYKVSREYYLNDAGNQINTLGKSVCWRIAGLEGEKAEPKEEYYQGEYIIDIAKEIINLKQYRKMKEKGGDEFIKFCGEYAGKKIFDEIISDLARCGIKHDVYFKETTLYKKKEVEKTLEFLKKRGKAFESEGALWFKSTEYGDDKDRVLKKSDGSYTYFAADIAYHKDKYDRGFDRVIDVWGADHGGYVARMKAGVEAIGHDPKSFDAVLIQLVNLVRAGELVSMSTRRAEYETFGTLIDEVGKDVCRYFFLSRSHNAQLDFDLELAKSQTAENPVYYIQYAHARISSVFEKAGKLKLSGADLNLLKLPEEISLARKLAEYPETVEAAANELEPHKIAFYLSELAKLFQSYYTKGKRGADYRFLHDNKELQRSKCYLLKNIQTVIKNGLDLLGVTAPDRMQSQDH